MAVALHNSGYAVSEIISRNHPASLRRARRLAKKVGARATIAEDAKLDANLVWFCVPDREIASVAADLPQRAPWNGKVAFHSSGALASDELDQLRQRGAAVAAVHPLMTFVSGPPLSLKAVPFGVEGDRVAVNAARQILLNLQAQPFVIGKKDKALYHAWGTFASPLLIALLATAEQVAQATGLSAKQARQKMLPILRQTLENYATLGPAGAFSGPIVRGDAATLRVHLRALEKMPEVENVYLALARAALCYLPAENRPQLKKLLGESRR